MINNTNDNIKNILSKMNNTKLTNYIELDRLYNEYIENFGYKIKNEYKKEYSENDHLNELLNKIKVYNYQKKEAVDILIDIRKYNRFEYYHEITDYIYILKKMEEKGIWNIIFTIGSVDFRDSNCPDIHFIEKTFLTEKKDDFFHKHVSFCYNNYAGLLPFCCYLADKYKKWFYQLSIDIIELLISGIEYGGVKSIGFAMSLYRFIKNSSLLLNDKKFFTDKIIKYFFIDEEEFNKYSYITNEYSYYKLCNKNHVNNIINKYYSNAQTMDKKVLTIDDYVREKFILIFTFFIELLENVPLTYFELTKLDFILNVGGIPNIVFSDPVECNLFNHFISLLIQKTEKDCKFYIFGKPYCGVIAYCFYSGYKWISYNILERVLKYLSGIIEDDYTYNLMLEFHNQLLDFIDSVDDMDFLILKEDYLNNLNKKINNNKM